MAEAVFVQGPVQTGDNKAAGVASVAGDVGSKSLATRNDNAATAQPGSNGQYVGISADQSGTQFIRERSAISVAKTTPAASATSATILAANAGRRGATIINRGSTVLSIDITGAAATATTATHDIQVGAQFELPKPCVTGAITGIWAGTPTGNAVVTETI